MSIVNTISNENIDLLRKALLVCKSEYRSYKYDVSDKDDLYFLVDLLTTEHKTTLFDGKPVLYKQTYLEISILRDGKVSWGVCYKKSDLNQRGVSDSSLLQLFKSLCNDYPEDSFTLTGVLYKDSSIKFNEE